MTDKQHTNYTVADICRQIYTLASPGERRLFWWLCVLNICMGLLEIGVAGGISLLGVAMSAPESLARFPLLGEIRAALPFPAQMPVAIQFLLLVLGIVCVATLCKNLLLGGITWLQNYFSQKIALSLGCDLFRRFLGAPPIWHTGQNSAELLTVLNWRSYVSTYTTSLLLLLTQLAISIFLLGGSLLMTPLPSCLLFISVALLGWGIKQFTSNKTYLLSSRIRNYDLHNSRVAMQGLHGLREVCIYDRKQAFQEEFQRFIPPYIVENSTRNTLPMLPVWLLETAGMFLLLLALLVQVWLGASVAATTGTLTLLAAVSWRLLPAANKIMGAVITMRSYQPHVEKLFDFVQDLPAPASLVPRPLRPFQKEIRLTDLHFTYPTASQPALDGVSLHIPRGSMVGIVGHSGSGKSTLIALLTGLLQPQRGQLSVDGQPWDPAKERLHIGYVPQQLYLLDATLAENVAFSHWGEPVDEVRVLECCRMAAMDFVDDLPDGIHTRLGERGVRLSGGQIQRVGIARALYDDPDLLVFDEATSALDGATEKAIQSTIESLRQHVTLVIVAHRLSTVEACDMLYWMDKGVIVKSGKPDAVLGAYGQHLQETAAIMSIQS